MKTEESAPTKQRDEFDLPAKPEFNAELLIQSIKQLEDDLLDEKDKRREHSFLFTLGIVFLFDVMMAKFLESVPLTIFFVIVQLILLVALAKRLGVDWIVDRDLFDQRSGGACRDLVHFRHPLTGRWGRGAIRSSHAHPSNLSPVALMCVYR